MKKYVGWLLIALLLVGIVPASAEEVFTLGGVVTEVSEETVLLNTEAFGAVLVRMDEQTELLGLAEGMTAGMYVTVTYDGRMTRSIPAQITAQRISIFRFQGEIAEALPEGSVLLNLAEDAGQLIVHGGEIVLPTFIGLPVTVYTNGMMAMSYPGQVTALHVDAPALVGDVTELGTEHFLLCDAEGMTYRVNTDTDSDMDAPVAVGDRVTVYYSGAMTFSLPAQLYGIAVVHAAS